MRSRSWLFQAEIQALANVSASGFVSIGVLVLGSRSRCCEREELVTVGAVPRGEVAEAEILQGFHGEAGLLRATAQHILLEEMHHRRGAPPPLPRGGRAGVGEPRPAPPPARPVLFFPGPRAGEAPAGRRGRART